MLMKFALRDASIVGASLGAWWWLAAASVADGPLADLTGWICGLLLGVCAYLAHEWAHFLGGLVVGSRMTVGTSLASGFLFSFDAEENSVAQFVTMSVAGFVATAAVIAAYYVFLPDAYLASRVARGGALFLALLGVTLELPLLLLGLLRREVPRQVSI